ncbi:hypothetical protein COLO4_00262 [Corchorus olitorius]|uniref:Mads box protein n=1 Tax=Corchorus olitorius TaxID=93759 RepID=A0A1R3L491_9ROSI|nr:hypothetical protein COLO4_00262 [Corchorus olitorius]
MGLLEKEKEKEKERGKNKENNGGEFWWDQADIETMGMEELEMYIDALDKLRKNVTARMAMDNPSSGFRGLQ